MNLSEIVKTKNLIALETYCMRKGKYKFVIQDAKEQGIDLDELEELLQEIS